jgi:hypothetical protein
MHYTGHTQKNGAVSKVNKLKPHHSFVYALYYQGLFIILLYMFRFQLKHLNSKNGHNSCHSSNSSNGILCTVAC